MNRGKSWKGDDEDVMIHKPKLLSENIKNVLRWKMCQTKCQRGDITINIALTWLNLRKKGGEMSNFQRWNSKASQVDGQMFQFAEETFKKNIRKNLEKRDKKKKTKIKVVCHTANWSYDISCPVKCCKIPRRFVDLLLFVKAWSEIVICFKKTFKSRIKK